jgi:hypothetical protein
MNKRLITALVAYAVLIAIGAYELRGKMLYALLIVFGGLIVKTLIAAKGGWTFHSETERTESGSEVDHSGSNSAL